MIVQKSYSLRVAALDPQGQPGRFTGTAVVFNEKAHDGDVIRPSCFAKSIQENAKLPLLWVHDMREPLGSIQVAQDSRALSVEGRLLLDIPRAAQVYTLMREGSVRGLSIGFIAVRSSPLEDGGLAFSEGRLVEVSLCPVAAFASAKVSEIKALGDLAAALDPARDSDALLALRDSIDAMLRGAEPPDHSDLIAALATFDTSKWRRR